jgi:guanylate kinase
MLAILIGVSGVGKTTILRLLAAQGVVSPLPVLTTRIVAHAETGRTHVSRSTIMDLSDSGQLQVMNSIYGNLYAVTKERYQQATAGPSVDAFDISPKFWARKAYPKALPIFLSPGSPDQVARQLSVAGNSARIDSALEELEATRGLITRGILEESGIEVVNVEGAPERAAGIIRNILGIRDSHEYR